MTKQLDRRDFVKKASATAAAGLSLSAASCSKILGANDRVRIGIIGPGGRGQELMKEFVKVPNAEWVAAADIYTRRHDEAKKIAPGIKTFNDHRALLGSKDVDAVIVATPLHCHARHFIDTLAAGKDMYCEKTMTWSIEEAESCLAAAKKASSGQAAFGLHDLVGRRGRKLPGRCEESFQPRHRRRPAAP